MPKRAVSFALSFLLVAGTTLTAAATAAEKSDQKTWSQFRGPNGSGVNETTRLPVEFGPDKNMIWQTPLPPGHSSPVLSRNYVFVTAFEDSALFTICLDRRTGKIAWRRAAPRTREEKVDYRNTPASPSPVTDGKHVFVFFQDYGMLAYDLRGNRIWQQPLGPFNNVYGMGASPVLRIN